MLKSPNRRQALSTILQALLACSLAAAAPALPAQPTTTYPTRSVRLIVPFAAGGFTDVLSRLIGNALSEQWHQPVVVENRPGANGSIGDAVVARAPADGYTLLIASDSHVSNKFLVKSLPYDTVKDFAPAVFLGSAPMVLMANKDFPANNVADIVRISKEHPNSINYGTLGSGSQIHLAGRMLETAAGIRMTPVPYKGGGPAVADLLAGNIQLLFASITSSLPMVKGHRTKALAVVSPTRLPLLPDVPTMAEQGYPSVEKIGFWFGFMAPAGTPAPVIEKVRSSVIAAAARPDVAKRLAEMGLQIKPKGPAEFAAYINSEIERWAELVKRENLQPR